MLETRESAQVRCRFEDAVLDLHVVVELLLKEDRTARSTA
jgi:hypothetical protein